MTEHSHNVQACALFLLCFFVAVFFQLKKKAFRCGFGLTGEFRFSKVFFFFTSRYLIYHNSRFNTLLDSGGAASHYYIAAVRICSPVTWDL